MRVFGLHSATLAATCMLCFAGCGGVTFENPLSDDETTQVDERLVGYWEPLPASMDEEEPAPGDLWHYLVVGRLAEGSDRMEAVVLDVDSGVVKVTRIEILPTRVGDDRYLSLINREEEKKGYFVVRYDLPTPDRMRIQLLDEDVFAKAVQGGALKGRAPDPETAENAENPHVTATTAELRAWFEKHAGTFVAPKRMTLRRLVERESSEEVEAPEPPEPPEPPHDEDSEGPDEEHDAEDEE